MTCPDDWLDAQQDDPNDGPEPEYDEPDDEPWRPTTDLPDIANYQPHQETP